MSERFVHRVVFRGELNAKANPDGAKKIAEKILQDLNAVEFDLLLVTDDDALNLVGKRFFGGKKKVVFAGINSPLTEYGQSEQEINRLAPSNVAGVLERYELLPLIQLVSDLLPQARNLILMFDESTTAQGVYQNCMTEIGSKRTFGKLHIRKILKTNSFVDWKSTIRSAKKDDVLLIFPYSSVNWPRSLGIKTPVEFADWIVENSRVPEFATASLSKSNNFFATVGISGFEHGEDAAGSYLNSLNSDRKYERIKTKNYARLKLNPERAARLGVGIPFALFSYSYALTRRDAR